MVLDKWIYSVCPSKTRILKHANIFSLTEIALKQISLNSNQHTPVMRLGVGSFIHFTPTRAGLRCFEPALHLTAPGFEAKQQKYATKEEAGNNKKCIFGPIRSTLCCVVVQNMLPFCGWLTCLWIVLSLMVN